MNRRILILLTVVIVLAACGRSEKARKELVTLNIEYSELNFIEHARDGNADVVKHFLDTSPGFGALIGGIKLEATEVVAVAAMLRAINVLENERSARDLIERIKIATSVAQAQELANLALAEIDDATEVLVGGGLHRKAQKDFAKARRNAKQAGDAPNASQRISEANQALGFLTSARADIIDP